MSRRTLTDVPRAWVEPLLLGKNGDPGLSGIDNRLFVDAARRGSVAGFSPCSGKWTAAHARFWRWSIAGVWERLFNALANDPDFEYVLIATTICKAHVDAAAAKGGLNIRRMGASAAGL